MLKSAESEESNHQEDTKQTVVLELSNVPKIKTKKKRKRDADEFGFAISCLKEERAEIIENLYKRFITAFKDKEDGGKGDTVHMEYMANKGNLTEPLTKRLKDEGFTVDVFTSRGRKIVTVDLGAQ